MGSPICCVNPGHHTDCWAPSKHLDISRQPSWSLSKICTRRSSGITTLSPRIRIPFLNVNSKQRNKALLLEGLLHALAILTGCRILLVSEHNPLTAAIEFPLVTSQLLCSCISPSLDSEYGVLERVSAIAKQLSSTWEIVNIRRIQDLAIHSAVWYLWAELGACGQFDCEPSFPLR